MGILTILGGRHHRFPDMYQFIWNKKTDGIQMHDVGLGGFLLNRDDVMVLIGALGRFYDNTPAEVIKQFNEKEKEEMEIKGRAKKAIEKPKERSWWRRK